MRQINDKETTDEIIQETRRIKEALAESMDFDLDRIIEETRKIRDAHAAKFQFDLHAICEDLRKKEKTCGHPIVSLPPKRILKKPSG